MAVIKVLFTAGPQHGYRYAVVAIVSILLMFLDVRFEQVDKVRQTLSYIISPVQSLVSLPNDIVQWSTLTFSERKDLLESNRGLKGQVIVLQQKIQRLSVLEAENNRLRELLDASARLETKVTTAELISVDPDPYSIQVIVDRGAQDGIYIGQSVFDAYGLFGLVVQVNTFTSRVALVADANLAVPVYVNRNGRRSVVVGSGDQSRLEMEFVPDTADVVIGDLLVTSGLGGRFPKGFPVAEVVSIEHDPGEPFARIRAVPLAKLGKSRNLLMVFQEEAE